MTDDGSVSLGWSWPSYQKQAELWAPSCSCKQRSAVWRDLVAACVSVSQYVYFHLLQASEVHSWCGCLLHRRGTGSEVAKVRKTAPNIDPVGQTSQNRKWLILCVCVNHCFMRKDNNAVGRGRNRKKKKHQLPWALWNSGCFCSSPPLCTADVCGGSEVHEDYFLFLHAFISFDEKQMLKGQLCIFFCVYVHNLKSGEIDSSKSSC